MRALGLEGKTWVGFSPLAGKDETHGPSVWGEMIQPQTDRLCSLGNLTLDRLLLLNLSYHEVRSQLDSKPDAAWLYSLVVRLCPGQGASCSPLFSLCNHSASKSHQTEDGPYPTVGGVPHRTDVTWEPQVGAVTPCIFPRCWGGLIGSLPCPQSSQHLGSGNASVTAIKAV